MNEKHINWSQVLTTTDKIVPKIAVSCLICQEGVELTPNEELYIKSGKPLVKVCDNCRKAILKVRSEIE